MLLCFGNKDTTLQHIGKAHLLFIVSVVSKKKEEEEKRKGAPWDKHVYEGLRGPAAPAAGGPLLPNEHRNLLPSQRCFSPDN